MSRKCVVVVDDALPIGLQANIAGVLCLSVGRDHPDVLGDATADADGQTYAGITRIPMPVLMAPTDTISRIAAAARAESLYIACFTDAALTTKNYDAYTRQLADTPTDQVVHHGLVLLARDNAVRRLTSGLPLLRATDTPS
jgi:hypothetical protein